MEFMILDYHDPLFSIIVLALFILTVFFANRWLETFKAKDEKRRISKFVKSFEIGKKEDGYKRILKGNENTAESLALLASIKSKSGEYEEAIKIYLSLLEVVQEKNSKIDIMTMLGRTYFKAGFMQRSKDILLEALELRPRNKEALHLLVVIYESLKAYPKALEVVSVLEELEEDVAKERELLELQKIINNAKLTNEKKIEEICSYYELNPHTFRVVYEFLGSFNLEKFWKYLKEEEIDFCIDILWSIPKEQVDFKRVENSSKLKEIYGAKGYLDGVESSSIFELNTLINLKNRSIADLGFEYVCSECGNTFPLNFHRCPSCQSVLSTSIEIILTETREDETLSSANFY